MLFIDEMKVSDISSALSIWHDQFDRYCDSESFPDFWTGGQGTVEAYLVRQIEQGNAIIAKKDNSIVGYMAWMYFDFHSERTAFLPIVGNAAVADYEAEIYHALYLTASQMWVKDKRFNHLWMVYNDNIILRDMLYDIGFGSYVIDACQKTANHELSTTTKYKVTRATNDDADAILAIANESERNLFEPPIFLVREEWDIEGVTKLISEQIVLIAWDNCTLIGLVSFDINQKHHFERLTNDDSAYIGGIGAYIRPEYRRKGVATQLLHEVFDYCYKSGKPYLHVSFETANHDAVHFWPKYFKPIIRSVRRTVNKDANY